jgi:hypothetical protein
MTTAGKRAEIAAAISAVPGCRGWERRPSAPNAGDGWTRGSPVLDRADAGGDAFLAVWSVVVLAPQDEDAAMDWWDRTWPPLYFALKPVGYVTRAEPVVLGSPEGDRIAYMITLSAEE